MFFASFFSGSRGGVFYNSTRERTSTPGALSLPEVGSTVCPLCHDVLPRKEAIEARSDESGEMAGRRRRLGRLMAKSEILRCGTSSWIRRYGGTNHNRSHGSTHLPRSRDDRQDSPNVAEEAGMWPWSRTPSDAAEFKLTAATVDFASVASRPKPNSTCKVFLFSDQYMTMYCSETGSHFCFSTDLQVHARQRVACAWATGHASATKKTPAPGRAVAARHRRLGDRAGLQAASTSPAVVPGAADFRACSNAFRIVVSLFPKNAASSFVPRPSAFLAATS